VLYPDWQFLYWFRSVFWKKNDFVYRDEKTGEEVQPGAGKRHVLLATAGVLAVSAFFGRDWIRDELPNRLRNFDARAFAKSLTV
jgi:hypothetical protein